MTITPTTTFTERHDDVEEPRPASRGLRPSERRPSRPMLAALRAAVALGRGPQGESWVRSETPVELLTARACARRGYAAEYRVTPGGQTFYRLTDAGRAVAA